VRFSSIVAVALATWLLFTATIALAAPSIAYRIPLSGPAGDTVALYAEEHGQGPPLLLLHGIGGSGFSFRDVVPELARRHRVITLDMKGFGASDKPLDNAYHPADQAHLVAAFLEARGLERVALVGHSFGGVVALIAAAIAPRRIGRLVLMNAPAFPQPIPQAQRFLTLPVVPYVALAVVPPLLTTREALRVDRRLTPPASDREAIAYAEPLYEAGGRHALIASTRAMVDLEAHDITSLYPRLLQPALVLACRHDPTVPLTTGYRLQKALRRARLKVLEACEHAPAEEQPAETSATILAFLANRR
jgi:pimeloyl-ACP methyl ester carboxylesterase